MRKKKEEKPGDESEKDQHAKITKDPIKKKEKPASHLHVVKAPKKKQGRGHCHFPCASLDQPY